MGIDKRIITLIEVLGLTSGEFADKINVQRSSISHITSGRNKPSLDFLERALTVFPEINPEWLILGNGKPLKYQMGETKEEIFPPIEPIIDKKPETETQAPLLFPLDDFKEIPENKPSFVPNNEPTDDSKREEEFLKADKHETDNHKELAIKEIKKVIILYNDNSFEAYES
ncbi:MAG: helix-turn-helix domain-containing protein [Flavobacteriaceae bacterium]|jgi:transcriptional regulator with XRE-family HTH domain|nr:helix-turn-helix domain-containing protein [Flavobacteriaceae bacterium]